MKTVLIAASLIVTTAGLGLYGIQGWTGTSGGHWVVLFGLTLILPAMWTESWLLGALVHIGFWIGIVWGVSAVCRTLRSLKTEVTHAADQQLALWQYGRLLIITVLVSLALGGLGFLVAPIVINALGFLLFWWYPNYNEAQGFGSGIFYLSLMLRPLGALYGVGSGILMVVAVRRWREKTLRIGTAVAIGYFAMWVAILLGIILFARK